MVRTCRRNRLISITEIRRGRSRVDRPQPLVLPMSRNFSGIASVAPQLGRPAHRAGEHMDFRSGKDAFINNPDGATRSSRRTRPSSADCSEASWQRLNTVAMTPLTGNERAGRKARPFNHGTVLGRPSGPRGLARSSSPENGLPPSVNRHFPPTQPNSR